MKKNFAFWAIWALRALGGVAIAVAFWLAAVCLLCIADAEGLPV